MYIYIYITKTTKNMKNSLKLIKAWKSRKLHQLVEETMLCNIKLVRAVTVKKYEL